MEDDTGHGPIASAMNWIQNGLTGSLASTIAVIAVASSGLLLLTARLEIRRAIQVIFGCFILFGASSIASGLMEALGTTAETSEVPPPRSDARPIQSIPALPQVQANYDPYADAAVPKPRR